MNNQLISNIIKDGRPCFFISPHLDDAVFSAGGLISYLHGLSVPITVINVFTSAGTGKSSLSANKFLSQCGYSSPIQLFTDRIKEDHEAFKLLPKVKIINLGYIDALWRTKTKVNLLASQIGSYFPELVCAYPTYRWHIIKGKIARFEDQLVNQLSQQIQSLVNNESLIFTPLGVGNHVDHIITREACLRSNSNIVYWLDFPYHLSHKLDENYIKQNKLEIIDFPQKIDTKHQLILKYKSQISPIFKNKSPNVISDIYYHKS
jgi:LmbE family N-acetylglucosaminyl deacetylase